MEAPEPIAADVAAVVTAHVRPFHGEIVHRQVRRPYAPALWEPGLGPYRWNSGFPALYTSLTLEVAFAERIKHTRARPVALVVGKAQANLSTTLNLAIPAIQRVLGVAAADLTGDNYSVPQRLGRRLYDVGVTALVVPAAIATTAALYPRFSMRRGARAAVYDTPVEGTNLVIYTDRLRPGDIYPEIERFACVVRGLRP